MNQKFQGLWPALLTPMTADGKPNFAVLERMVELYVKQGLDGIYTTGSTGQWPLLSFEERASIVDCVVKTAAGRIPIMAHIGGVSTEEAIQLAKRAAASGADAVSSVAPIYYAHSEPVIFEHYRRIGAATNLPFFAYHLYVTSSAPITPQRYATQLKTVPNLVGMKVTDLNVYTFGLIQSLTEGKLLLFSGADEVLCHAVISGSVGAIGTFYNLWGPVCQKARQAMVDGKVDVASKFMLRFQLAIARVLESGSIWSFLRAAMQRKYDLDIGAPRAPLGMADQPWEDAKVREILDLVEPS
ncbi:MAG: dihydrodipicolinate synthase family protein [Planctomycetaceae bacterium]